MRIQLLTVVGGSGRWLLRALGNLMRIQEDGAGDLRRTAAALVRRVVVLLPAH